MFRFSNATSRNKNLKFKTTRLGVEQLEPRLMNAIDGIESLLAPLVAPANIENIQVMASNNLRNINTAPRVQASPKLQTGTEVRGTSARLIVHGSDDQGESKLTYTWSVISAPTGGSASFDMNGTNKAKGAAATFTRAGQYQLRVVITDQAGLSTQSNLSVNVAQVPTVLKRFSVQGTELTDVVNVTSSSQLVVIRGTDQFGQPISSLRNLSWTVVKQPIGGNVTASNVSSGTNLAFTGSGSYTVRATSGDASLTIQLNVVPTLSSISMQDSNKASLRNGTAIQLTSNQTRFHAVGLDQFGIPLKTQPQLEWTFPTKPNGANPLSQASSNRVDIKLDRVGAYVVQVSSGNIRSQVSVSQGVILSRIELLDANGNVVDPKSVTTTTTRTQVFTVRGFDQFGQSMAALPALTWTTTKAPTGGRASGTLVGSKATLTFTDPGTFSLTVASGKSSASFQVNVLRTLSSLEAVSATNSTINPRIPLTTNGKSISVTLRGVDQFGKAFTTAPDAAWTVVSGPSGNSTRFLTTRGITTINFNQAGIYVLRAAGGNGNFSFTVQVTQQIVKLNLTPGNASMDAGGRLQFQAAALDQFGNTVTNPGGISWTATGGTISSTGMFQAGSQSTTFRVIARSGEFSAAVTGTIAAAGAHSVLTNSALRGLVSSLYVDNSISRLEMIQILRSVGTDGVVGADELTDLRLLVSSNSNFLMPSYVRELAKDVVNSNPANAKFLGQTAGNLSVGSSATLLNNLVDKWFLGADLPLITGSGITYQTANGVLFSGTPSRNDARQGYLGDCYFLASITSIADQTAAAIQNMFLDNGDGTFTVRFFGSLAADYVTVNKRLPGLANGTLAYSGLGLSLSSTSTSLWVALAEKAYAQWNETGQSGRDGTNSYAGIEGGWMSNVNRQVLGYASSNYAVSTSSASHLASQLSGGRAVTIGTKASVSNGLVGSHAYIVTGYNSGTGTFDLFNPWGNTHPGPLTWSQIQANCDFFAVTDSSGTTGISTLSVRNSVSETSIGNWTSVLVIPVYPGLDESKVEEFTFENDAYEYEVCNNAAGLHSWVTPDQNPMFAIDEQPEMVAVANFEKTEDIRTSDEIANDLAFTFDNIEDLLRS